MRELPIIMSGNNPALILAGSKVMTRRLVNPQPFLTPSGLWRWKDYLFGIVRHESGGETEYIKPPSMTSYQIGDLLWVKEACWMWGMWTKNGATKAGRQKWRFDPWHRWDNQDIVYEKPILESIAKRDGNMGYVYRHARFMPKKYARIWLEVTSVRVERLDSITIDDIYAEGAPALRCTDEDASELYEWYSDLWDSLHAKTGHPFESNPWVSVTSFKRINKEEQ